MITLPLEVLGFVMKLSQAILMSLLGGKVLSSETSGSLGNPGVTSNDKIDQKSARTSESHDEAGTSKGSASKDPIKTHPKSLIESKNATVDRPEPKLPAKDYTPGNIHDENAKLKSRLAKREGELKKRHREIEKCRQAVVSANQLRTQREEELSTITQRYEVEIRTLRAKEQSLRDFVLHSNDDQAVSGDDIVSRFTSIRQKIQKLASSKTYQLGQENLPLWLKDDSIDASLSKLWEKSSRSTRLLILRSLIFQILSHFILSCEIFDIRDDSPQEIRDLANALGRFERTVIGQGVSDDIVVNWRLSTFKCIEKAQLSGQDFGRKLQMQLFDGFSYLMTENATEQDKMKLKDGYLELCKDARNLQLLMRQSRDPYQCWSVKNPSLKSLEPWSEVFEEINDADAGKNIAFTLFGALIKHSRIPGAEPKVLEKAQIIATVNQDSVISGEHT